MLFNYTLDFGLLALLLGWIITIIVNASFIFFLSTFSFLLYTKVPVFD